MSEKIIARLDESDRRRIEELKKLRHDIYVPVVVPEAAVAWALEKLKNFGFEFDSTVDVVHFLLYDIVVEELKLLKVSSSEEK
jgi:hypothetical protein